MKFKINSLVMTIVITLACGLTGPVAALAVTATAPNLGTASSFSVFAGSAMTADGAGATVSADLGVNPGLSVSGPWTHIGGNNYFGTGGLSGTAKTDATTAWTTMGSTGGTTWDPSSPPDMTPAPGLYTRSGDATLSTTLTLNGGPADVWIFQINDSLTFTNAATVVLGAGVDPCNVYWRIASDATINGAPGNTFVGTLIANGNVSLVTAATVNGRMMALTGTLSTGGITNITGCASAAPVPAPAPAFANNYNTLTVVKQVINDNGGTARYSDFPLFVNGNPVGSGQSVELSAGVYTVTETNRPGYVQTFTGNCNASGQVNLGGYNTQNSICTVVNNDVGAPAVAPIPPLIDVVKVPSPLALPAGPGSVTYTYTVKNIGTVPMTDVTLVGDTCSPIILSSGDTNGDTKLDVTETWIYRCTKTLSQTTTNIVTATGHANGLTAIDVASATVVVGAPIVPPLIHITKVPDPLALPAGAGMVTYTKKVTNPGTVALSNVSVTDDLCGPVMYVSGDTNNDSKLDPVETWTYTCQTKLTKTTTNTAIATGSANGLTATDFALATVVVALPKPPKTGVASLEDMTPWSVIVPAGIAVMLSLVYITQRKRTA